jgi:hypothetical protein
MSKAHVQSKMPLGTCRPIGALTGSNLAHPCLATAIAVPARTSNKKTVNEEGGRLVTGTTSLGEKAAGRASQPSSTPAAQDEEPGPAWQAETQRGEGLLE